jgi:hypothetical protein
MRISTNNFSQRVFLVSCLYDSTQTPPSIGEAVRSFGEMNFRFSHSNQHRRDFAGDYYYHSTPFRSQATLITLDHLSILYRVIDKQNRSTGCTLASVSQARLAARARTAQEEEIAATQAFGYRSRTNSEKHASPHQLVDESCYF